MRLLPISASLACLILAGCGGKKLPPETDAAKGRELMKTVLDAWKRGGTAEELRNASPAVVARDPDWLAGYKLTNYEVGAEDARAGLDLLLTVKLNLIRPDGRPQEKRVRYTVGIGPSTVVLRAE